MGGKEKQAHRTKGNTKASSSARAAELLESFGGGAQGFMTLGGDLGYVPVSHTTDEADSSVDADFRMLMRKLTKKDTTTKIKALQEMATLCSEKDLNEVKTALPFWPRLYAKLSIDHERRVREATQLTLKELVCCVGRDVAPQLKSLMGAWLVSQCDPYTTAATVARTAFTSLFSPSKRKDTLVYCKKEIMAHIEDLLLNQTPETLSDKKCTAPEDMQSKYERTVACGLLAWKELLCGVPPQDDLLSTYHSILKQAAFWKLHTHQSELVRSGFYSLLSALCQFHPALIQDSYPDKACTCTLYRIDDTSAVVCFALWEALLQVVSVVEDWYERINPKKGFLPKLWRLLKQGGESQAAVIYPSLLPLISKLPSTLITGSDITFLDTFFETLKTGLSEEKVVQSSQTVDLVITSFMECLRYIIKQNFTDTATASCELLVDKLSQIVEASLYDDSDVLSLSPLYTELAQFLVYLSKQRSTCPVVVDTIEGCVWADVSDMCVRERVEGADRVARLLCTLPTSQQHLLPLATKVMLSYYQRIQRDGSVSLVQPFCRMIQAFASEELFTSLVKETTGLADHSDQNNATQCLLQQLLLPLLQLPGLDVVVMGTVVDVVVMVISHHSVDAQKCLDAMLQTVLCGPADQMCTLMSLVTKTTDPDILTWLKGESFGEAVLQLTHSMCQSVLSSWETAQPPGHDVPQDVNTTMSFLTSVIAPRPHNILDTLYVERVVSELQLLIPDPSALPSYSIQEVWRRVSFICGLAAKLFPALQARITCSSAQHLLLTLFELSCSAAISDASRQEVKSAWLSGVTCLLDNTPPHSVPDFFTKATECVKSAVLSASIPPGGQEVSTLHRVNDILAVAVALLETLESTEYLETVVKATELPFKVTCPWQVNLMTNEALINPAAEKEVTCLSLQTQCNPLPSCLHDLSPFYFTLKLRQHFPVVNCEHSMEYDTCKALGLCEVYRSICGVAGGSHQADLATIRSALVESLSAVLHGDRRLQVVKEIVVRSTEEGGLWSQGLKVLIQLNAGTLTLEDIQHITIDSLWDVDNFDGAYTGVVLVELLTSGQLVELCERLQAAVLSLPQDTQHLPSLSVYLAMLTKAITLITDTKCDVVSDITGLVSILQQWHDTHETLFNLQSVGFKCWGDKLVVSDWQTVSFQFQLVWFLCMVVERGSRHLTASHWDFILCKLVWWLQESRASVGLMHKALCQLLSNTAKCMVSLSTASDETRSLYPPQLTNEWTEFFSETAFNSVLPILLSATGDASVVSSDDQSTTFYGQSLCEACTYCTKEHLLNMDLPVKLIALKPMEYPEKLESVLNYLCPLLLKPQPPLQSTVYTLLTKLTSDIAEQEESRSTAQDEESRQLPAALWEVLEVCGEAVSLWIRGSGVEVGGSQWSPRQGEEMCSTAAYFYCWSLCLDLFTAASSTVRACYARHLRDSQAVDNLMYALFCIMPSVPAVTSPRKPAASSSLFEKQLDGSVKDGWTQSEVGQFAGCVYVRVLEELPALIRQWWNKQDRRVADIVDKFTSKFVSPWLCDKQISEVRQNTAQFTNLKVQSRPVTREVIATYCVDEASIELVVTLAHNHPLGPIKVEQGKKTGIATNEWRNWMLQLTTFLLHQNGSIVKGLELWKRNVDKKFEGVEECYVCYSIIHGTTCRLPRLQCKTCKKKFHSSCLYKWFNTSNNSTCPLCRNLF